MSSASSPFVPSPPTSNPPLNHTTTRTAPSSSSSAAAANPSSIPPPSYPLSTFSVSQRVQVDHARGVKGSIRYIGPLHTHPATQPFVGLQYDPPTQGKHDGTHAGHVYFQAPPLTSVFVRHERLLPGRSFDSALREKYEAGVEEKGEEDSKLSLTAVNEGRGRRGRRRFDVEVQFVGVSATARKIANSLSTMQYAAVIDMQVSHAGDTQTITSKIPNVIDVDLSNNLLVDWEEVAKLVQALPHLRALTLSHNSMQPFPSSPPTLPSTFSSLRALVLNSVPHAWPTVLHLTSHLPLLTEVHCAHNQLSTLKVVEEKEDESSRVMDQLAERFQQLTTLDLSYNAFSDWTELCHLQRLPRLQSLHLHHNQLTSITYPTSSQSPPPFAVLSTISLSDNSLSSFDSLTSLSNFPSLTSLTLQRNPPLDSLSTTPSLLRLHTLARLPSLLLLNSSTISARERSDGDKFYMAWVEEQVRVRGRGVEEVRYEEMRRKYGMKGGEVQGGGGEGVREGKEGEGTLGKSTVMVEMRMVGEGGEVVSGGMKKRVLLTMRVTALRAMVERQFKVAVGERGQYVMEGKEEETSAWEAMEDPMKSLLYYGLKEGSIIALRKKKKS